MVGSRTPSTMGTMITSSKSRAALLAIAASATLALSACSVGAPSVSTDSPKPVAGISASTTASQEAPPAAQAPNGSPQSSVDDDCEWDADDREWDDCDEDDDDDRDDDRDDDDDDDWDDDRDDD